MSLYKTFATDESAEQDGITVDYGDTRFLIARAGGANHKFKKVFSSKIKPYRRQIDQGTMSDDAALKMLAQAYAESVVLTWQSKTVDEKGKEVWLDTIEDANGEPLKFSVKNCTQVLLDLPELFTDLQTMAGQAANFKQDEVLEDVKN